MRIKTDTTMSLYHYHDFYFVSAILANINGEISRSPEVEYRHSVSRLLEDAKHFEKTVFPNMAKRVFMYIWAACLGEARHSSGGECRDFYIPEINGRHRHELFAQAANFAPTMENIETLIKIFDQKWGSGFGGQAWKNIAEALKFYFNQTPAFFIDHVADLEHNNGTVFSKGDATNTILFDVQYQGRFSSFLDFKFSNDILTEKYSDLLVSYDVYQMVKRYQTIFKVDAKTDLTPDLHRLGEYEIEWGNERITLDRKWKEFARTKRGNSPDAYSVWEMLKFPVPTKYTKKQYKKLVNRSALRLLSKYPLEGKNLKAFNKMKNGNININDMYYKVPKAKKTYNILPVEISYKGSISTYKTKAFEIKINDNSQYKGTGYFSIKYGSLCLTHDMDGYEQVMQNKKVEAHLD